MRCPDNPRKVVEEKIRQWLLTNLSLNGLRRTCTHPKRRPFKYAAYAVVEDEEARRALACLFFRVHLKLTEVYLTFYSIAVHYLASLAEDMSHVAITQSVIRSLSQRGHLNIPTCEELKRAVV
ncbi:MAG: hypothetical protein QW512_00760 [Thermofilaceae archaeon]